MATPRQIIELADEYRKAGIALLTQHRNGVAVSRAPSSLCCIHAIELYLNAFLRHHGQEPGEIRAIHHNLDERSRLAVENGLILRKKPRDHLERMTESREYIASRYGAEMTTKPSEITRLSATRDEVSERVRKMVIDDA